jgi:integrase/recombinase XerC/integrase/recombinase XerD
MMREDNAVQVQNTAWNGLQTVSEENWRFLLEMFLNSQDISEKSRQTYSWALMRYFEWLRMTGRRLSGLTPADIVGYKSYLLGRELSPLTVSSYLSALRQFYCWTEVSLFYPNIARSVKAPRSKKGFVKLPLSAEQASELLDYLKGKSARNYAIVNLILRTGLRTIEVSRLDVKDVVTKRGRRVLRVWGKGMSGKDSLVILNDPAWEPIKDYLAARKGAKGDEPLFLTDGKGHRGKRLSPRSIQDICKQSLRAIGLDGHEFSAHSLRHSVGVNILRAGGDMKDVQRVLRHSSPVTSQIYTATVEEEIRLERNPEALLNDMF